MNPSNSTLMGYLGCFFIFCIFLGTFSAGWFAARLSAPQPAPVTSTPVATINDCSFQKVYSAETIVSNGASCTITIPPDYSLDMKPYSVTLEKNGVAVGSVPNNFPTSTDTESEASWTVAGGTETQQQYCDDAGMCQISPYCSSFYTGGEPCPAPLTPSPSGLYCKSGWGNGVAGLPQCAESGQVVSGVNQDDIFICDETNQQIPLPGGSADPFWRGYNGTCGLKTAPQVAPTSTITHPPMPTIGAPTIEDYARALQLSPLEPPNTPIISEPTSTEWRKYQCIYLVPCNYNVGCYNILTVQMTGTSTPESEGYSDCTQLQ